MPTQETDQTTDRDVDAAERAHPATLLGALPPGTAVLAWPGTRDGSPLVTQTRGAVWSLGDGTRVVAVEGHAGGIALTNVDVLPTAARDRRVAAKAWDEGYAEAEHMARCWGHTDWWENEPKNPHRATEAAS